MLNPPPSFFAAEKRASGCNWDANIDDDDFGSGEDDVEGAKKKPVSDGELFRSQELF